jgi:hypothetical protein
MSSLDEKMQNEKSEHLRMLHELHGGYELAQIYRLANDALVCSKRLTYQEAVKSGLFFEVANLRTLLSDEVLFDFESQTEAYEGMQKLDEDKLSYTIWKTGSRGFHAHAYFRELAAYLEDVRQDIRLMLINKYGADPAKKAGLLALEYAPHFKTGRYKVPVVTSEHGENRFDSKLRSGIENVLAYPPKVVWKKDTYIKRLCLKIPARTIFGGLPKFRKVGKNYMMLCPFHADKEPSLAVPIDKPVFHCFGCGAKGDWVKFIMLRDGIGFRDAKRRLEDLAQKGDVR